MKYLAISAIFLVISGCASNPRGSSWAVTDFNKYDKNYAAFPTHKLIIGTPKQETLALFNYEYELVEADSGHEVVAYQQWVSVGGPDYVGKTLYLNFSSGKLANWKVTTDTVSIVPRSW